MNIFDIDLKQQKELLRFFKKFPKQARYATAGIINNFAFGSRKQTIQNYNANYIIRNQSLLKSSTRVIKANGSQDVNQQMAVLYFQQKKNFSGFVEQELGTSTKRQKTVSTAARGGSRSSKVRKRFKTGQSMDTPENTGLSNNIGGFLQYQKRKKSKAFLLTRQYKSLGKGVYYFKGSGKNKQLTKLQNIGKIVQPKKKPIMYPSSKQYISKINLSGLWQKEVTRQLEKLIEYRKLRV